MTRQTRNRACIWIIALGLANFLGYTVIYAGLGGDAKNGGYGDFINQQGEVDRGFYISGHFLHGMGGQSREVARWVWIYSFVHSISLWPTHAAALIAMLILARPHIIASMGEKRWIEGSTFVTVCMTLIAVLCGAAFVWFTIQFVGQLVEGCRAAV